MDRREMLLIVVLPNTLLLQKIQICFLSVSTLHSRSIEYFGYIKF